LLAASASTFESSDEDDGRDWVEEREDEGGRIFGFSISSYAK
jgi:hypothetical protein